MGPRAILHPGDMQNLSFPVSSLKHLKIIGLYKTNELLSQHLHMSGCSNLYDGVESSGFTGMELLFTLWLLLAWCFAVHLH